MGLRSDQRVDRQEGKTHTKPSERLLDDISEESNKYKALADPSVHLSLKSKPEKVGVYVDYEGRLVSFHDVDTGALIYSFTGCSFNEKLYPFFNPCNNDGGKNSAPLVICSLNNVKFNVMQIYSRIPKFEKNLIRNQDHQ